MRLSEKQIAILERRRRVVELLTGKTEKEISIILGVSPRTIVNDVSATKELTSEWVNNLPRYIVLHRFKRALSNSDARYEILEKALKGASNIFEVVTITKELRDEDKFSTEILGKAPTVYALKLAMERGNVQGS